MKKKTGFTLTEVLIMTGVIGVIAVVTIVSLMGLRPNKNEILVRKAYGAALDVVQSLANDEDLYPPMTATSAVLTPDEVGLRHLLASNIDLLKAFSSAVQQVAHDDDLLNTGTSCTITASYGGSSSGGSSPSTTPGYACMKANVSVLYDDGQYSVTGHAFVSPEQMGEGGFCLGRCTDGYAEKHSSKDNFTYCVDNSSNPTVCIRRDGGATYSCTGLFNSPSTSLSKPLVITTSVMPDPTIVQVSNPTINSSYSDPSKPTYWNSEGTYEGTNPASDQTSIKTRANVFGDTAVHYGATEYTAANKFSYNFAKRLKTNGSITKSGATCNVTTNDGMYWTIIDGFGSGGNASTITIDINGSNKGTNSGNEIVSLSVNKDGQVTIIGDSKTYVENALTKRR